MSLKETVSVKEKIYTVNEAGTYYFRAEAEDGTSKEVGITVSKEELEFKNYAYIGDTDALNLNNGEFVLNAPNGWTAKKIYSPVIPDLRNYNKI